MAVHPNLPGVSVTVNVNGHQTHELDDPIQDNEFPPTVRKYIMYANNRSFAIRLSVQAPYDRSYKNHILRLEIYRDGKYAVGVWLHPSESELVVPDKDLSEVMKETRYCCFFFSSTSQESAKEPQHIQQRDPYLGTIGVHLFRIDPTKLDPSVVQFTDGQSDPGSSFKFTRPRASTSLANLYQRAVLDEDNRAPIAVYKFFYRSERALQQELRMTLQMSLPVLYEEVESLSGSTRVSFDNDDESMCDIDQIGNVNATKRRAHEFVVEDLGDEGDGIRQTKRMRWK